MEQVIPASGSRLNSLIVEHLPIGDLKPYPAHARRHSRAQIRKLARSITAFGIVVPPLIDRGNVLIAGHGVVEAARLLGYAEVPVLRVEALTETQVRSLRLALNRLAEDAVWDREALSVEIADLIKLEIDTSITGFEVAEIDLLLDDLSLRTSDRISNEDDLSGIEGGGSPVSRLGDLMILGRHKLLVGDARDPAAFQLLMGSDRAAMAFADVPYNVRISHIGNRGATQHPEFAMASGEMSEDEYTAFLQNAFRLMAEVSVDGAVHFICTDAHHLGEMTAATKAVYGQHLTVVVWNKDAGGMGGLYRNQTEFIFAEKVGTAPIVNNVNLGRHGRNRTNLWTYRGLASFGPERQELLAIHPTAKPVALVADAILDVSKRNDIVLDPFGGSGTTLLAAEKTGRAARLIEIEPRYCDITVRRWERYTGKQAVHAQSGMTFEEMANDRASLNKAAPRQVMLDR